MAGEANPMTVSHGQTANKAKDEFLAMPMDKIATEITSMEDTMRKVLEEVGENVDLAQLKAFEGTPQEKAGKIVDLNSRLSGARSAWTEKESIREIANQNSGSGLFGPDGRRIKEGSANAARVEEEFDPRFFSNSIRRQMGEQQIASLKIAERSPLSFDMQVPTDDVYNAIFRRTAGWEPFVRREPGISLTFQRMIRIFDIVPMLATDQSCDRVHGGIDLHQCGPDDRGRGSGSGSGACGLEGHSPDREDRGSHSGH